MSHRQGAGAVEGELMSTDLKLETQPATLAERIARQADALLAQQADPTARHEILTTVQARRAWRGEQTLDIVREDDAHELLTVRGQIVLRSADLASEQVRAVVDAHALTVVSDDLAVVLETTGDVPSAVRDLRDAGATATAHHVTLLQPVVKPGFAGPVADAGLGSFETHRATHAR
jgi:hypothetical protein